jgi:outer membrane protein TolC
MQKLKYLIQTSLFLFLTLLHSLSAGAESLYEGFSDANKLADEYQKAELRLREAIKQPEYMLKNWVNLPIAPDDKSHQRLNLSMQEAILLALRYNPDIQNAELDRIIQRYQLRQAYNEFELQFALAGSANFERNHFSDVGSSNSHSLLATPEVSLKTKLGTRLALRMDNNVATYDSYNPVLNFSITQPLLRGLEAR